MAAKTAQDIDALRQKYRDATLANISFLVRQASKLELPKERALAEPFLKDAAKRRLALEEK